MDWDLAIIRQITHEAPNMSLNRHDQFGRDMIRAIAVAGTFLQTSVVVFFGLLSKSKLKEKFDKNDKPVVDWAFLSLPVAQSC